MHASAVKRHFIKRLYYIALTLYLLVPHRMDITFVPICFPLGFDTFGQLYLPATSSPYYGTGTVKNKSSWALTKRNERVHIRLANEDIKSQIIKLVIQATDGSTEVSVVSRSMALKAAQAANLDLVQGDC